MSRKSNRAIKTKAAGVGTKATSENKQHTNNNLVPSADKAPSVIESKSTAIEVQLAKVMALLLSGPKTTIQLRDHGIMMPAARIHFLRHAVGHDIQKELVTLYDGNGFRHSKCARYHLINEASCGGAA